MQLTFAQTMSAGVYLNKLLSTSGTPNSEIQILDTKYILKYDEYGMPGSVLTEGKTLTIAEFLDTEDVANYLGIKNGEGAKDYVPAGKSNIVPENFNGEVFVSSCLDPKKCKMTTDGGPDLLADIPALSGGNFDRDYNGISGSVPESDSLSKENYELSNLNLASSVWGISEVGQKLCKPAKDKYPVSTVNWWVVLKNYIQAEKFRKSLHEQRVSELQTKVSEQTSNSEKSKSKNYQLDALTSQIDLYNLEIDSISGSSLYSGGDLAQKTRETSRIAWRETVLAAVYQAIVDSKKEDEKVLTAYNLCTSSVEQSLSISTKACSENTKICEEKNNAKDPESKEPIVECEEAKLACEMQNQNIPLLKKVALNDIVTLYLGAPIPSKVVNEKYNNLFNFLNYEVNVFFPKSITNKHGDWIAPLKNCLEPLRDAILANGLVCPASAADTDYDKNKFVGIGRTSDLIGSMNHYTVGENNETSSPSYAHSNSVFKLAMEEFQKNNPNATEDEIKNYGLRTLWLTWINSPYSKNYLADKPINFGLDPVEEDKFAKKVMADNNLKSIKCSDETCRPVVQHTKPLIVETESAAKISESARNFLISMGVDITDQDSTVKYLEKNWNLIDMYLGQSHMRLVYFQAHQDLLTRLIESDRFKLSTLLVERQKLIDSYVKLKNILDANSSGSNLGGLANGSSAVKSTVSSSKVKIAVSVESSSTNNETLKPNEIKNSKSNSSSSSANVFMASSGLLSVNKKSSSSKLTKSSTSGTSNINLNGASSSYSVSANSKINKALKSDAIKSQNLNKFLNAKNSAAESTIEMRVEKFDKKIVANLAPIMKKESLKNSLLGETSTDEKSNANDDFQFSKIEATKSKSKGSNFPSTGANYYPLSNQGSKNYNSTSKKSSLEGNQASNSIENADQKRIKEVIDASKYDKSKTESSSFDSIFDQITKAYIRNYDKVK